MQSVKKIVIIGPESTGKSSLTKLLALHYKTEYCDEFAREYLLINGTKYSVDDLLQIAKGQLALEDQMTQKVKTTSSLLFIDTDMYVMKVWSEYVFGECNFFILDNIASRSYDLYLLCDIDLPWVKDELREYPDEKPRKELFNTYKDLLINQNVPWKLISGNYEQRLTSAIDAVNKLL
jgi:NadR type nicotinamide-nucleotide adenylyltransferase